MTSGAGDAVVAHRTVGGVGVVTVLAADVYAADEVARVGHDLRRAIDAAGPVAAVVIDLAPVQYLSSGALGLLINLRAHLVEQGYGFALAGAAGEVADVIRCTRLAEVVPVYATVEDALRALGPCGQAGACGAP